LRSKGKLKGQGYWERKCKNDYRPIPHYIVQYISPAETRNSFDVILSVF